MTSSSFTLHTPDISTMVPVSLNDELIQYLLIPDELQRLLRTLLHYFMLHTLSKLKVNQGAFCHNCKLLLRTSLCAYVRTECCPTQLTHLYYVYTETSTETVCVHNCMYFCCKGFITILSWWCCETRSPDRHDLPNEVFVITGYSASGRVQGYLHFPCLYVHTYRV